MQSEAFCQNTHNNTANTLTSAVTHNAVRGFCQNTTNNIANELTSAVTHNAARGFVFGDRREPLKIQNHQNMP
jgi:hypothetical protein